MIPKEKAKQLFESYLNVGMGNGWAKECALIAADEMYNIAHRLDDMTTVGYLLEVIKEIEQL